MLVAAIGVDKLPTLHKEVLVVSERVLDTGEHLKEELYELIARSFFFLKIWNMGQEFYPFAQGGASTLLFFLSSGASLWLLGESAEHDCVLLNSGASILQSLYEVILELG